MNLRPLGDRVLIQPIPNPDQTASGLYLAEQPKPEESGTVVAVGPCEHPLRQAVADLADWLSAHHSAEAAELVQSLVRPNPLVQVGDFVLFSWASGQEILIDDERYLLMRESDILAVCEGVSV